MLRYIMRTTFRNDNGCEGSKLYTIDGDAGLVEEALLSGGMSEGGFERNELMGVEVIKSKGGGGMGTASVIKEKGFEEYFALMIGGEKVLRLSIYDYDSLDDPEAWFCWLRDKINKADLCPGQE